MSQGYEIRSAPPGRFQKNTTGASVSLINAAGQALTAGVYYVRFNLWVVTLHWGIVSVILLLYKGVIGLVAETETRRPLGRGSNARKRRSSAGGVLVTESP